MKILSTDEKGNTYEENVEVLDRGGGKLLSFGGPCSYYIRDLVKDYPFNKPLCIDMGGRNHQGVPDVCVSADVLNTILSGWVYYHKPLKSRVKDCLFYLTHGGKYGYGPKWTVFKYSWRWSGDW